MTWRSVTIRAEQTMHLGTGRGSGFSRTTRTYVPASTLRGAVCAAWWRDNAGASQTDFDTLIAATSFSDALAVGEHGDYFQAGIALDRRLCKYRAAGCPVSLSFAIEECPSCGGPTEAAKGQRPLPAGAVAVSATRVALTSHEQAVEDRVYEREGLSTGPALLKALTFHASSEGGAIVGPGTVIRLGGSSSVAGRAHIESVDTVESPRLQMDAGTTTIRIEMLTEGVFVDDFGQPVATPTDRDLRWSLGLARGVDATVRQAFTRWTTSGGWHRMTNLPKPVDVAVVAHSVYYVDLDAPDPLDVPALVCDLGLRTSEGCGWARITTIDAGDTDA